MNINSTFKNLLDITDSTAVTDLYFCDRPTFSTVNMRWAA